MAYHVAYLTKAYNIPLLFVVNNDQINIHSVPFGCYIVGVYTKVNNFWIK
jgi:hypothetical protein